MRVKQLRWFETPHAVGDQGVECNWMIQIKTSIRKCCGVVLDCHPLDDLLGRVEDPGLRVYVVSR